MRRILFISAAILGSYILTAFIFWTPNPAYWDGVGRVCFLLILLFSVGWAWVLTVRMKSYNDFIDQREERKAESNRKAGGFTAHLQKQLDAAEQARREQKP